MVIVVEAGLGDDGVYLQLCSQAGILGMLCRGSWEKVRMLLGFNATDVVHQL